MNASGPSERHRAPSSAPWRSAVGVWCAALLLGGALLGWRSLANDRGGAGGDEAFGAPGEHGTPRGPRPVFAVGDFPVDRIDRIEVRRDGAEFAFERSGDGWSQVRPFEQPADGAMLRELLVRAADLRATRRADPGSVDAAAIGLEPPLAELRVRWADGSRTLRLGRRAVGGRAWLRVDDGAALAADPSLHESVLEADPRRWRSWRLFDRVGAGSDRVIVVRSPVDASREAQRLELVREQGRWRLVSPIRTRADSRAVDALLAALARAEHAGFVDDEPRDPALYGLEHPIASVEVVGGGARGRERISERVEIGSGLVQGGALCARRDDRPPVFLLDRTSLAALLPPAEALVDGRACAIDPVDVKRIGVKAPDGTPQFELERTLDGWRLIEPDGRSSPARTAAVAALLERLCAARAQKLAIQPMPAELLRAVIEVTPGAGAASVIRVAREPDDGQWALDESDDCLRVFPPGFDPPLDAASFRGG